MDLCQEAPTKYWNSRFVAWFSSFVLKFIAVIVILFEQITKAKIMMDIIVDLLLVIIDLMVWGSKYY